MRKNDFPCSVWRTKEAALVLWRQSQVENLLVVGVGIDVATVSDFQRDDKGAALLHRLFSTQEYMPISVYPRPAQPAQKPLHFSSKEAALKSLAPMLRDWNSR
ncbi:MAG: 4'-phosphopantetheinyl transferase superfamily protein [Coriobacteriales bacterium]|jgi:4'-phosphopantetheinyl transferase EntD|nr:4'-phosphopantetheinyl transferase superfamily protein [Coriobacteriales bacterium]